jgi:hypothetical protein
MAFDLTSLETLHASLVAFSAILEEADPRGAGEAARPTPGEPQSPSALTVKAASALRAAVLPS